MTGSGAPSPGGCQDLLNQEILQIANRGENRMNYNNGGIWGLRLSHQIVQRNVLNGLNLIIKAQRNVFFFPPLKKKKLRAQKEKVDLG